MSNPQRKVLGNIARSEYADLSTHERAVLIAISERSYIPPSPVALPPDQDRFIDAEEAQQRLGVGKTKFYELRNQYPELSPISSLGPVRYLLSEVLSLLWKLHVQARRQRVQHHDLEGDSHAA